MSTCKVCRFQGLNESICKDCVRKMLLRIKKRFSDCDFYKDDIKKRRGEALIKKQIRIMDPRGRFGVHRVKCKVCKNKYHSSVYNMCRDCAENGNEVPK